MQKKKTTQELKTENIKPIDEGSILVFQRSKGEQRAAKKPVRRQIRPSEPDATPSKSKGNKAAAKPTQLNKKTGQKSRAKELNETAGNNLNQKDGVQKKKTTQQGENSLFLQRRHKSKLSTTKML